ncbi:MAG: acetyl-CoA decarbonylase/synthase complex subunit delta [Candidatus Latescibacterota bacterium]
MAFDVPKLKYSGAIREVQLGRGEKAVTVGGETCYPFYLFEGEMPHAPRIAMEVYDATPEDWPPAALEPFAGVTEDAPAWARRCVEQYGAEMICLQLASTDPNGADRSAAEATGVVRGVAQAVDVPLIVWGCGNVDKDAEVLRQVAETCQDRPLVLGPVTADNYRQIGAAAIAYKHTVAASTPIDINLCKQLNILLGDLGVPDGQIIVDPTTGGLGYGLEYTYSVMERTRMAALTQQDERLQFPILCNLAREVWKVKEVKTPEEEDPKLGDPRKRGVLMEAVTAMSLLLAGADVLVMRHPEAIARVRRAIAELGA